MKKLLIVGAGIDQVPAIQKAKELGHEIHAVDFNPEAPGFAFTDRHAVISTTDIDGVAGYCQSNKIDGLFTVSAEKSVRTVAAVGALLGLPTISTETALAATDKGTMRQYMRDYGLAVPGSLKTESLSEALKYAETLQNFFVIKPSDSSGQRGVKLMKSMEDFEKFFSKAQAYSSDRAVMIEEFIPGPEINITAIMHRGTPELVSISDRVTKRDGSFGVAIEHLYPTCLSQTDDESVIQLAFDSMRAIKMTDGIAYPQIIMSPSGPQLVEVAARIPGGNMREMALYQSGIDLNEVAIRQALDEDFVLSELQSAPAHEAVMIKFITRESIPAEIQVIKAIRGLEEIPKIPNIKEFYLRLSEGDQIPPLENGLGRFGAVMGVGSSRAEVQQLTNHAIDQLQIT